MKYDFWKYGLPQLFGLFVIIHTWIHHKVVHIDITGTGNHKWLQYTRVHSYTCALPRQLVCTAPTRNSRQQRPSNEQLKATVNWPRLQVQAAVCNSKMYTSESSKIKTASNSNSEDCISATSQNITMNQQVRGETQACMQHQVRTQWKLESQYRPRPTLQHGILKQWNCLKAQKCTATIKYTVNKARWTMKSTKSVDDTGWQWIKAWFKPKASELQPAHKK